MNTTQNGYGSSAGNALMDEAMQSLAEKLSTLGGCLADCTTRKLPRLTALLLGFRAG